MRQLRPSTVAQRIPIVAPPLPAPAPAVPAPVPAVAAALPPPQAEHGINPPLWSPIRSLPKVGAHFSRHFASRGLCTLRSLVTYLRTHTPAQGRALLADVLKNPRATQCVGDVRRVGQEDRQYLVARENRFAHNAIVAYAKQVSQRAPHLLPANRVPPSLARRRLTVAYPHRCAV